LTESFSALAFPPLDAMAARCSRSVISFATTRAYHAMAEDPMLVATISLSYACITMVKQAY
jgi:hypothetical protein